MAKAGLLAGTVILFILIAVFVVGIVLLMVRRLRRRRGAKYMKHNGSSRLLNTPSDEVPVIKPSSEKGKINGVFKDNPDVTVSYPRPDRGPDLLPVHSNPAPNATNAAPNATRTAPNATRTVPNATRTAPNATRTAPNAVDKAPSDAKIEEYYNVDAIIKTTVIQLTDLPQFVKFKNKEKQPFSNEFEKFVKEKDPELSWAYAEQEELKPQNRFKNIIPYDHARVTLKQRGNDRLSDYVNASFIDGFEKKNAFIACHGPVERTMPGVWRMIWEYNVPTIVMVTNFTEYSTMKVNCEQYWPSEGKQQYGVITVTMTCEDIYADFTIRKFTITHAEEPGTRHIAHYHYTTWPDHGVPANISSLLKIRRLAKQASTSTNPVVVHCRAGIGRTGTFIAMDSLLDEANATGHLDIFTCVKNMRKQRINMVQTLVQYAFLYDAINESTMFGETAINISELAKYCSEKMQGNPSLLDKQFKVLEETKPVYSKVDLEEAQAAANDSKNRDPNVIPSSAHRVFFVSMEDGSNPYFNAVPIKGYKAEIGYFATQVPLNKTIDLFWKLVHEQQLKSIVCLQTSNDGVKWFPTAENDVIHAGGISVTCTGVTDKKGIQTLDLTMVTHSSDGGLYANTGNQGATSNEISADLRLFYSKVWADTPIANRSKMNLIDVRDEVVRWQAKEDKPILVVCLNGATECGLYIATSYLAEMANSEQEVDVAQVVKQIRVTRPQLLANNEQYKFLHDVMVKYVESYSTYSNG